MTEAERLAEIDRLVEEQQKDDTHEMSPQYFGTHWVTSLDSAAHDGDEAYDWLVGVEHEDRLPFGPSEVRVRHDFQPIGRHGTDQGGVLVRIPHGTTNGYGNYRCRCPLCRAANTKVVGPRVQAYRKSKQDARPDRICANEKCRKPFRPVPSTKLFCSYKCADATRRRNKYRNDSAHRERDKASRRARYHAAKMAA